MPDRPTPYFLVIGAARSGTTYLTRQLDLHPEISISDPKEPHFLAFAGRGLGFAGPGDDETINRRSIIDEGQWRQLFTGGDATQRTGEGSVSTLYYAEDAIPNIKHYCPDARMIVLLRDPVERAFSAFQYWTSRGFETETFGRGLDLEDERIRQRYHHIWHYTRMGFYSDQLSRYFDAFPREQFLVMGYEDFMGDRQAGLERCQQFLGVSRWQSPEQDLGVNAGGTPRSRVVATALRKGRTVEPLRKAVKAVVPFTVRERIRAANIRREEVPVAERRRLEELFAPERTALRALLGDDAPGWARR